MGRLITGILVCFEILMIAVAFTAEWNQTNSSLGFFPCYEVTYTEESIGSYNFSVPFLQGDMNAALVNLYGLPLADGIIVGYGALPSAAPLPQYSVNGPGPAISLRVSCDSQVYESNGTTIPNIGAGLSLINFETEANQFNGNVLVYLPASFLNDLDPSIESSWIQQWCSFSGVLGKANWTYLYSVDSWNTVAGGLATAIQFQDESWIQAADLFMDYSDRFSRKLAVDNETSLIMTAIGKSIYATMDDVWLPSTGNVPVPNYMTWGTQPDGYLYANETWRGLSAGLAASFYQVLQQFSTGGADNCEYFGSNGSGNLVLNIYLVYALTALLGLIAVLSTLYSLFLLSLYRFKTRDIFTHALRCIIDESARLWYSSQYVSDSYRGRYRLKQMDELKECPVMLGEKKANLDSAAGALWIGPSSETVSMRKGKPYS